MNNSSPKPLIGIIGGVGPQAGAFLYQQISLLAQQKYGARQNDDYPEVVIHSIPVPDFISDRQAIPRALAMFEKVVEGFERVGVTHLAIGSNTVHVLLPEFSVMTDIPIISLLEAVIERVRRDKPRRVGLVASPVTVESGLYQEVLEKEGVQVVIPDHQGMVAVEKMLRSVIAGTSNGELRQDYLRVTQGLFERGAEGIILGCTELPLAIRDEVIDRRIYNSTTLLAERIVDVYYQGNEKRNV